MVSLLCKRRGGTLTISVLTIWTVLEVFLITSSNGAVANPYHSLGSPDLAWNLGKRGSPLGLGHRPQQGGVSVGLGHIPQQGVVSLGLGHTPHPGDVFVGLARGYPQQSRIPLGLGHATEK